MLSDRPSYMYVSILFHAVNTIHFSELKTGDPLDDNNFLGAVNRFEANEKKSRNI